MKLTIGLSTEEYAAFAEQADKRGLSVGQYALRVLFPPTPAKQYQIDLTPGQDAWLSIQAEKHGLRPEDYLVGLLMAMISAKSTQKFAVVTKSGTVLKKKFATRAEAEARAQVVAQHMGKTSVMEVVSEKQKCGG